eukprot:4412127-Alexandrium_andersonii.AAC.1
MRASAQARKHASAQARERASAQARKHGRATRGCREPRACNKGMQEQRTTAGGTCSANSARPRGPARGWGNAVSGQRSL